MHDLATHLDLPLFAAHGIMEMLWHHAGDYSPEGDIGKLTDAAIARAVDWKDDPSILIGALVESKFLDRHDGYRLLIHDWPDHAQEWVKKKLKRIQKKKAHEDIDWLQVYIRPAIPSSHSVQPDVKLDPETGNNCRPAIPSSHSVQSYPRAGGFSLAKGGKGKGTSSSGSIPPERENLAPAQNGNGSHNRKQDHTFTPFQESYTATGKALTDYDWDEAWYEWRPLDIEQRTAALTGIAARIEAGLCAEPEFVMLPKNYLKKREWQRAIAKRKTTNRDELEAYWQS